MTRLAMIFDLEKCYGCDACAMVCRDVHLLPSDVSFLVVKKSDGFPERVTAPVLCMHCDMPDCVDACAFGALGFDDARVVVVDDEVCTGCGACVAACPVGALSVTEHADGNLPTAFMTDAERRGVDAWQHRRDRRIPAKCELCSGRRRGGRRPACVSACPVSAVAVGDLDDPESDVRRLMADHGDRVIAVGAGTPRVFYVLPRGADPAVVMRLISTMC